MPTLQHTIEGMVLRRSIRLHFPASQQLDRLSGLLVSQALVQEHHFVCPDHGKSMLCADDELSLCIQHSAHISG